MSTELPEELPPGFEFGGYVIRACIGRGGMARVYRAEQAALQRAVALKVLDRWVLDEESGMDRFLREARVAASIKHPNVVDILDVGVWRERPFIVMELLSGHDLETHLGQRQTLSDVELVELALPLISGMVAVHEAGVVHRDLKPSNIFLSDGPDGEIIPKVLDFGVSKFSGNLHEPMKRATKTREIIGTPTYMAPEALNGVRELGPRADQYSLGAVLYECAVGRPPFEGETLLDLLKELAFGTIAAPSTLRADIHPALERAIMRAVSSDPNDRFDNLRDMGRALWPIGDARTQSIWQPSFGAGHSTQASRQPAGLALGEKPRRLRTTLSRSWLSLARAAFRGQSATWQYWGWPLGVAGALTAVLALHGTLSSDVSEPAAAQPAVGSGAVAAPEGSAAAPAPAPGGEAPPHAATAKSPAVELNAAKDAAKDATEIVEPDSKPAPTRVATSGNRNARKSAPPRRRAERPTPKPRPRLSSPTRRSQPAARRGGRDADGVDSELDGLFVEPRDIARPAGAPPADRDLAELFPTAEPRERGANGSFLPD